MSLIFTQTTQSHQTDSMLPVPIPELNMTLPEGVGEQALLILNVPNVYATTGGNVPGGRFGISVNGTVLPAYATFMYNSVPPSGDRLAQTLVVAVPLTVEPQQVQAVWQTYNGCTVVIDTPASLSAQL
jgi:hypothetical protein